MWCWKDLDVTIPDAKAQSTMTKKRQHPHAHLLRLAAASLPIVSANPTPSASDPSVAYPDRVKFEYAEFVSHQEPGKTKLAQMETAIVQGPVGFAGDISRHWAIEEFFWHGVPGDDWHPLEAYLAAQSSQFPPAGIEQLRLWKQARIGLYEVGSVAGGTVGLQEWDPLTGQLSGEPLRAIALNIGGVDIYRGQRGRVSLSYVAPWSPAAGVHCAMGYSTNVTKRKAVSEIALMMLGLRQPALACQPYPWQVSRAAGEEALRAWRQREWHGWLAERLAFPFQAFVRQPPQGEQLIETVTELLPSTPADARKFGIYLAVEKQAGKEVMISGLTGVIPTELASPNWLPIAEYHAYRERVGPPPGNADAPSFIRVR
jgi:hypothetical protein